MRHLALAALLAMLAGCNPFPDEPFTQDAVDLCRQYCVYQDLILARRIFRTEDGDLMCECQKKYGGRFDAHIKYMSKEVTLWMEDEPCHD